MPTAADSIQFVQVGDSSRLRGSHCRWMESLIEAGRIRACKPEDGKEPFARSISSDEKWKEATVGGERWG